MLGGRVLGNRSMSDWDIPNDLAIRLCECTEWYHVSSDRQTRRQKQCLQQSTLTYAASADGSSAGMGALSAFPTDRILSKATKSPSES